MKAYFKTKKTITALFITALILTLYPFKHQIIHHFFTRDSVHTVTQNESSPYYNCCDIICFSYDRPMQLQALLASIQKRTTGIGKIVVVYRSSSDRFEKGYQQLMQEFSTVSFLKEGSDEENHFKSLTIHAIKNTPSDFVLFACDDDIVTDDINLKDAVHALVENKAYVFQLRLGTNITSPNRKNNTKPYCVNPRNDLMLWTVKNASGLWHYVNNLEFSIYNKTEILPTLQELTFYAPNTMEAHWAESLFVNLLGKLKDWSATSFKKSLCYTKGKLFGMPLNLVNEEIVNEHLNQERYSKENMLEQFLHGEIIDIDHYRGYTSDHVHMMIEPVFKKRGS